MTETIEQAQAALSFNLAGRIEQANLIKGASFRPKFLWVPTEQVLLTEIMVPGKRASEWQQALPFVLEESLAQPIEKLHFAVLHHQDKGGDAGKTAVAVVDKQVIQGWLDELKVYHWEQLQLVPDCFQIPFEGQTPVSWQVMPSGRGGDDEVNLVRTGPFTGLAAPLSLLQQWYDFAQQKTPDLAWQLRSPVNASLSSAEIRQFGLRQGAFQPKTEANQTWKKWRGVTITMGLLFVVWLAQMSWQTQQLAQESVLTKSQTAILFHQLFPQNKRIVNIRAQTKSYLANQTTAASTPGPARLLKQMEGVLLPLVNSKKITLGKLVWQQHTLRLTVTAAETNTLEQLVQALKPRFDVSLKLKQVRSKQVEAELHVKQP